MSTAVSASAQLDISDLSDAELDRLTRIIATGNRIRAIRGVMVTSESRHRSRMDVMRRELAEETARLDALRAGVVS